jgi:hypothetical protein
MKEHYFDNNNQRVSYTLEKMREMEEAEENQPIDPGDAACNREYDIRAEIIQQKEEYLKKQRETFPAYDMTLLARRSKRDYKNRHSVKITLRAYHSSITFPVKAVIL